MKPLKFDTFKEVTAQKPEYPGFAQFKALLRAAEERDQSSTTETESVLLNHKKKNKKDMACHMCYEKGHFKFECQQEMARGY